METFILFNVYPIYNIGDEGTVTNSFTGKVLKGLTKPDGYKLYYLKTSDECKGKWFYAHRLVATHYIPKPDNLTDVNHLDGNKLNNNKDNLAWSTHRDNVLHSYQVLGRKRPTGVNHWNHGKTASEDTKKKMSQKKVGENHPKFKGWYFINGVPYASSYLASKATGLTPKSIYTRCMKGVIKDESSYKFVPN